MFIIETERIIEGLEKLRRKICCYGPDALHCDCKYGASMEGEETGCPEVRAAIELLKAKAKTAVEPKEGRDGLRDAGEELAETIAVWNNTENWQKDMDLFRKVDDMLAIYDKNKSVQTSPSDAVQSEGQGLRLAIALEKEITNWMCEEEPAVEDVEDCARKVAEIIVNELELEVPVNTSELEYLGKYLSRIPTPTPKANSAQGTEGLRPLVESVVTAIDLEIKAIQAKQVTFNLPCESTVISELMLVKEAIQKALSADPTPTPKAEPLDKLDNEKAINSAWALLKMAGDWIEQNHKPRSKYGKEDKAVYLAKVEKWLQDNA